MCKKFKQYNKTENKSLMFIFELATHILVIYEFKTIVKMFKYLNKLYCPYILFLKLKINFMI